MKAPENLVTCGNSFHCVVAASEHNPVRQHTFQRSCLCMTGKTSALKKNCLLLVWCWVSNIYGKGAWLRTDVTCLRLVLLLRQTLAVDRNATVAMQLLSLRWWRLVLDGRAVVGSLLVLLTTIPPGGKKGIWSSNWVSGSGIYVAFPGGCFYFVVFFFFFSSVSCFMAVCFSFLRLIAAHLNLSWSLSSFKAGFLRPLLLVFQPSSLCSLWIIPCGSWVFKVVETN